MPFYQSHQTPAWAKTGGPVSMSTRDARTRQTTELDVASRVSSPAQGGKEDTDREQRAGCCAGHPLDCQHPIATPHRHACQFGGHTPAAQPHTHTYTQAGVHRARFSVRRSVASWRLPCHRAPSLEAPGAFVRDPDEVGGVTTEEDSMTPCLAGFRVLWRVPPSSPTFQPR